MNGEQAQAAVRVVFRGRCAEVQQGGAWLELARAELSPRLLAVVEPEATDAIQIVQDCDGATFAARGASDELRTQSVPLEDVPEQLRARVLSLSLVEFALAGEHDEPREVHAPKPIEVRHKARSSTPLLEPMRAAKVAARIARVRVGALGRLFLREPNTRLWGGHGVIDVGSRLSFSLTGLYARNADEAGKVAAFLTTLGTKAVACRRGTRVRVACSLGAELGVTGARSDDAGDTARAFFPVVSALAGASAAVRTVGDTHLVLQLGVGYGSGVVVRVDGAKVARVGGPFTSLSLTWGGLPVP